MSNLPDICFVSSGMYSAELESQREHQDHPDEAQSQLDDRNATAEREQLTAGSLADELGGVGFAPISGDPPTGAVGGDSLGAGLSPDPTPVAVDANGVPDFGMVELNQGRSISPDPDGGLKVDIPAGCRFLLEDLEKDAGRMAGMLTHITGGLKFNLHAISGVCAELIQVHHTAVTDVSAALDLSVAAMSSLMVGAELIQANMPPVETMHEQLALVMRTLDVLEAAVDDYDKVPFRKKKPI